MAKHINQFPLQKYFQHYRQIHATAEPNNMNKFDLSRLQIGKKFAQGTDSCLHHGKYNDQHVAVKVIQVHGQEDDKKLHLARLRKQFNQEVGLLSKLNHRNVLKFIGSFPQPEAFCIITEFMSNGCLRSYLNRLRHEENQKPLSLQEIVGFSLQIARGMEYVHSQGVIHTDLKPENVLINFDHRNVVSLKIADFGVSCEKTKSCEIPECNVGTYRWMAPELIKRKKSCNSKVDVYSFSLILYEMISGRIPFADLTPIQVAYAVVNKNLRPDFPKECPDAMRGLIEQCWCLDPKKRPEFGEIVRVLETFEADLARDGTLNLKQRDCVRKVKRRGFFVGFLNRNNKESFRESFT